MKLIGHENGRVTLLADALELAPETGIFDIELIATIQKRYNFSDPIPPAKGDDSLQVRFEKGQVPDGRFVAVFEIHQQGLVVQASQTDTADAFLEDLFGEGKKLFGIRRPSHLSKRVYFSSLVVEMQSDAAFLLTKAKAIYGLYGTKLKSLYDIDASPSLDRLTIKPDPERLPPRLAGFLSDFTLQRRVFAPFEANRFYSTAPLPTSQHLEFLQRLDELAD